MIFTGTCPECGVNEQIIEKEFQAIEAERDAAVAECKALREAYLAYRALGEYALVNASWCDVATGEETTIYKEMSDLKIVAEQARAALATGGRDDNA